ncbi:aldo/keto reductase [Arthrobacter sp. RAF14]|uniref:aldo/keto reductase n=1 Tax=Arthrobacter sp. RAF14 TaxID=3233051 RepID=UPI003F8DDE18
MQYSVLGPTGIRTSKICLGSATFGIAPSSKEAAEVVSAALDAGVNFFDTANVYGNTPIFDRPGHPAASERESAEEILGRALAGRRDDVVLATKSGEQRWDPDAGLSRRYVIGQVEQSLRRLGTDYIDVYYGHFPDSDTPLEETLAVYDDLIRQGKIRYAALSNHPAWQMTEALWIADDHRLVSAPVAAQVMYSLIDRSAEKELAPACTRFGLSIVAYAPLHGGLLADLKVLDREIAGGKRYGGRGFSEEEIAVARELNRLAEEWGLGMQQVSLAWLLSRPAVASVIVGAETASEVLANTAAGDVELTPEQLSVVSALTDEQA